MWQTVKLGDVATIERETIAPSAIEAGTSYLGLEHIEAGGEIAAPAKVQARELASMKFRFGPQHVLYGKLRPYLAKIALPEFEGICSTDILPIKPCSNLDRAFLAYFLRQPSMVSYAASRSSGANLPRLKPEVLSGFEMPLPPLQEQKSIAKFLEQADELRRLRQRAITKFNGLGQSIFYDMFLSKANQWEQLPLSELGDVITGSTPPTSNPEHFNGDIPFVTPGDLEVDEEVRRHISILGASKSRVVEQGATFVCCIGATIGKMGQALRTSAFNQQINAVQWKDDINSEYGFYALKAKKREIVRKGKGSSTTLPILKKSEFQKIQIPVPPLNLQKKFSERLGMAQIDSKLMGVSSRLLKDLFSSLQQRAFRGELQP